MFIVLCIVFSCCGSGGADWANVASSGKCNWWNVTYLLDVASSNPLPLLPPPIPLHMLFKVRIWLLSNIHKCCIISNTHTHSMDTWTHIYTGMHTHTHVVCRVSGGEWRKLHWEVSECVCVCVDVREEEGRVSMWVWGEKREGYLCGCGGRHVMLESPVEYALIRTMMQQFKFLCPYMVTTSLSSDDLIASNSSLETTS